MARKPRFCPAGFPVHVIQRGVNRRVCFADDADMANYANSLREASERFQVQIHAWALMTNHVHLLMTPETDISISQCMQHVGRCYVPYFNFRYQRVGTLFQGRFRSSLVQTDRYFLACLRYIELNPLRAGLVDDPADYVWSSYRCHAFAADAQMWTPHSLYLELGRSPQDRADRYRKDFAQDMDIKLIEEVRHALNRGLALGTERFRAEIERLRGQSGV